MEQDRRERARTAGLAAALDAVAPALEAFVDDQQGADRVGERERWQAQLDRPLPDAGLGADAVLASLSEWVVPYGLRLGNPGFSGWVTTAPTVVPAVAQLAAAISSPQKWWLTPGNLLEEVALRWLRSLLGLGDAAGALVSGGMMANFLGLAAARQHAGERHGIDPSADGVAAMNEPRLYAGEHVHHVMLRSLGLLGLGRKALVRIPVDRRRGLDTDALAATLDADLAAGRTPIAVVASAGDVNTGRIDPIDTVRAIAHARGVWLHVDGAYGGFGVLDPRVRDQYGDLTQVDSLAVDPHKWLAVPVGCGAGFVRDGDLLERAMALEPAAYVEGGAEREPRSTFDHFGVSHHDHTLEHSSPSRGVAVWAALAEIGADGMRARVARHLDCARRVAERVRAHPDLELLAEPVLSICCFRYHPPALRDQGTIERLNQAIVADIRARGLAVPSTTRVRNIFAIRPCFIGPRADLEQADLLVDEVLRSGVRHDSPARQKSARS